jgi:hypothetical protein
LILIFDNNFLSPTYDSLTPNTLLYGLIKSHTFWTLVFLIDSIIQTFIINLKIAKLLNRYLKKLLTKANNFISNNFQRFRTYSKLKKYIKISIFGNKL